MQIIGYRYANGNTAMYTVTRIVHSVVFMRRGGIAIDNGSKIQYLAVVDLTLAKMSPAIHREFADPIPCRH